MANNFNFSPDKNSGFNFTRKQPQELKNLGQKKQYSPKNKASGANPFSVDDLFKFKKDNVLYDRVMQSPEMLGVLKAQKVANQFINLTKPEHQVGKRLDFNI